MLRNYEMKDEINCFIIFTIYKYEIFYIIIRRNIASHKIISSRTKYLLSFRMKCIDQAKQYISFQTRIIMVKCFVRDERGSTISNISFSYDITYSIFGTRKFYETIYFVFHFVITQHIKNPCVRKRLLATEHRN
jgi:hypothetical protein